MGWEIERVPVKQPTTDEAIKQLSMQLASAEDVLEGREKMILNLQAQLEEAGKVCTRLNSENVSLQEQCSQLLDKQYQDDYRFENQKKMFANVNKTLERYEKENKALRELLTLWI